MPNPNMTHEELRKHLLDWKTRGGYVDEIIQLFTSLCAEVIGEDEEVDGLAWRSHHNQLRTTQRTRLAQLTTKNTEEENV